MSHEMTRYKLFHYVDLIRHEVIATPHMADSQDDAWRRIWIYAHVIPAVLLCQNIPFHCHHVNNGIYLYAVYSFHINF